MAAASNTGDDLTAVHAFLSCVDDNARDRFLHWLPQRYWAEVIGRGPLQGTSNPSAVLEKRMLTTAGVLHPPLELFCQMNNLGPEVADLLRRQKPQVLRNVLQLGSVRCAADPTQVIRYRIDTARDAVALDEFREENHLPQSVVAALRAEKPEVMKDVLGQGSVAMADNPAQIVMQRIEVARRDVARRQQQAARQVALEQMQGARPAPWGAHSGYMQQPQLRPPLSAAAATVPAMPNMAPPLPPTPLAPPFEQHARGTAGGTSAAGRPPRAPQTTVDPHPTRGGAGGSGPFQAPQVKDDAFSRIPAQRGVFLGSRAAAAAAAAQVAQGMVAYADGFTTPRTTQGGSQASDKATSASTGSSGSGSRSTASSKTMTPPLPLAQQPEGTQEMPTPPQPSLSASTSMSSTSQVSAQLVQIPYAKDVIAGSASAGMAAPAPAGEPQPLRSCIKQPSGAVRAAPRRVTIGREMTATYDACDSSDPEDIASAAWPRAGPVPAGDDEAVFTDDDPEAAEFLQVMHRPAPPLDDVDPHAADDFFQWAEQEIAEQEIAAGKDGPDHTEVAIPDAAAPPPPAPVQVRAAAAGVALHIVSSTSTARSADGVVAIDGCAAAVMLEVADRLGVTRGRRAPEATATSPLPLPAVVPAPRVLRPPPTLLPAPQPRPPRPVATTGCLPLPPGCSDISTGVCDEEDEIVDADVDVNALPYALPERVASATSHGGSPPPAPAPALPVERCRHDLNAAFDALLRAAVDSIDTTGSGGQEGSEVVPHDAEPALAPSTGGPSVVTRAVDRLDTMTSVEEMLAPLRREAGAKVKRDEVRPTQSPDREAVGAGETPPAAAPPAAKRPRRDVKVEKAGKRKTSSMLPSQRVAWRTASTATPTPPAAPAPAVAPAEAVVDVDVHSDGSSTCCSEDLVNPSGGVKGERKDLQLDPQARQAVEAFARMLYPERYEGSGNRTKKDRAMGNKSSKVNEAEHAPQVGGASHARFGADAPVGAEDTRLKRKGTDAPKGAAKRGRQRQ